jgi:hypothetical protein
MLGWRLTTVDVRRFSRSKGIQFGPCVDGQSFIDSSLLKFEAEPVTHSGENMTKNDVACLVCKRGSEDIPLIPFEYKGSGLWICPQHLPVLIHDPTKLADVLPGADSFEAADHKD